MTSPTWLIAEREFRTYVATLSFWAALMVGPLAAGGGLMLVQSAHHASAPISIQVVSQDAGLLRGIESALREAGTLEGHRFAFGRSDTKVTITAKALDNVDLYFSPGFPLSPAGRDVVARTMERDAARRAANATALSVHAILAEAPRPGHSAAAVARFLLMLVLWLTLTGSLGMLLQTVVRERATRALESLLASADPWQIMAGKLIGVGGISFLVLAAWLGSSVMSAFIAPQTGLAPAIFSELAAPVPLLRAGLIYLLAYFFYGSTIMAVGAIARDSTSAQNLSRPMFIVLVIAFFVALAVAMGHLASLHWLLYIPAFSPFLLLLAPNGAISPAEETLILGLIVAVSLLVARFAIARFALTDGSVRLIPRLR